MMQHKRVIQILSVAIPLVVAILFGMPKVEGVNTRFLPPIYAAINGVTAFLLIGALWAVKTKRIATHKALITICLGLSALFLICYVAYHLTNESTPYLGQDPLFRGFYYVVLISHIILSILVIPFVLTTYSKALLTDFKAHKKWARYAFPLWLYVAVSGVIVYLMISPYYA